MRPQFISRALFVVLALGGMVVVSPVRVAGADNASPETVIWFDAPAKDFTASSPMGNGRLGAMMFGGVDEERIVLNESSVWSGSRQEADREDAHKVLPEIRRLLLAGKNTEAENLVNANFTCKGPGSGGGQYGCYQVLGNLHLNFFGATNLPATNYRRELNLDDAVTRVRYQRGNIGFTREMFVSKPDEVMVLKLGADQPKQISFEVAIDRPERFATVADGASGLLMSGQMDNGIDGKGMKYAARVRVVQRGGKVAIDGTKLRISGADDVTLFITASTDYQGFAGRQTKDPVALSGHEVNQAARKSFEALLKAHVADYQSFFRRVALHLGPYSAEAASQPTPERIKAFKAGSQDVALAALYFNFGRYLLISSSRPGGLPANLQGIWAEELSTPWTGDWHLDVNVQMNYWPAEICNLSDLHQPLFALIDSLQEPGAKTARAYYDARGWVAHVITNPWGFTSPGESASWGASTGGSAWLCQHLWDHWLFTRDRTFLAWAYPILKGSAQFYADMLIEDAKHKYLVVAPANSPENHFVKPDGQHAAISLGTTVHDQMLRYLFGACIDAASILNIDADFRNELIAKRARLAPTPIGSDGRVMEWPEEYAEPDIKHRHISHLWGLYPGDEITPAGTPALAAASRKTLEVRGDDGVGWSCAYKAALWARLGDGDHAWLVVRQALSPVSTMEVRYDNGGGVYPNLFDACPPFQIDGNFGVAATIAEMLVQSHLTETQNQERGSGKALEEHIIELLPALPKDWSEGEVSGLRARGGFEVAIVWKGGKLVSAMILSKEGETCRVRYGGKTVELVIKRGERVTLEGNLQRR